MLGTKVRDKVSGYEGIVTARVEYLHGEARVEVERVRSDLGLSKEWFEESRVEAA